MTSPTIEAVAAVVTRVGNIPVVGADEDIFQAGMSSVDALQLLLELENVFQVSIPDEDFVGARTPRDLTSMIERLSRKDA
jgi:acyl carrier protein